MRARPALPRTASACRPSTGSDARAGELVWCTAASGWSKSARNVFIAPWLSGAAALLHDARFDPARAPGAARARARERAVHGADRVPRDRQARDARARCRDLRAMVAAGEALNPEVLRAWQEATGLEIRDGYGQTETGQLTGAPLGERAAAGLDGPRRCRASSCAIEDGELIARPGERADLLPRLPRRAACERGARRRVERRDRRAGGPWRTGDRVRETRTAGSTSRGATTT